MGVNLVPLLMAFALCWGLVYVCWRDDRARWAEIVVRRRVANHQSSVFAAGKMLLCTLFVIDAVTAPVVR
jgi:hypothetical protein